MHYQHKEQLKELIKLIDKTIVEKMPTDQKENKDPNVINLVQDLIIFKIRIGLI
jgi:hypothetical protein